MKYIFLDIDGVLNAPGDTDLIEGVISKEKYALLKQIMSNTKARVIIISSRKKYEDERNTLLRILDDIYYDLSFISYVDNFRYRKDEIKCFLSQNRCDSFVILDDIDSNYTIDDKISNNFILINGILGLTLEDVRKAIKILNKK